MVFRKRFILAGGFTFALFAGLAGCNREARDGGTRGASESGPSTVQRASLGELKRHLDAVDERLQAMRERVAGAGEGAKQAMQEEIARLEAARDRLYGQLQALQTAGAGEWENLKTRTAHSVDSLSRVVAKTWKDMGDARSAGAGGGE